MARSPIEAFKLYVKVGDAWYEALQISAEDPVIEELRASGCLERFGPSPQEVEEHEQREKEKRQQRAAEDAYKQSRRDHHRKVRERAEERRLAALEERSYGR